MKRPAKRMASDESSLQELRRRHRQPCPELPEEVRQLARGLGDQLGDAPKGRWRQFKHAPVLLPAVTEAANPLIVDLLQQQYVCAR